jgi:putative ABC transport system permease protein
VAVVNQAFARRYFPREDPIGRRILLLPWVSNQYREIVGIVGDVRQDNPAEEPPPQIYVPQKQMPWIFTTLLIRLRAGTPASLPLIRDALRRVEPTPVPASKRPSRLSQSANRRVKQWPGCPRHRERCSKL